ncbi:MAG: IS5 family transposase [Elusimicrobiota bacterium]|jgi:IS5 family transposase|nr:IS5 family transposase [Elusimicrobiota bacterium]
MYIGQVQQKKLFNGMLLIDLVNPTDQLYILEKNIDWKKLENDLSVYYDPYFGAKAKPIRLMAAMLILKYIKRYSDKELIYQCTTNYAVQHFIGYKNLSKKPPCDRSLLSVFRKRIGKEGCEILFRESIRIHGKKAIKDLEDAVIIDSTVQEKYTSYPTDINLAIDTIRQIWKIGDKFSIKFRNKHKKEVKKLRKDALFNKSNKKNEIKEKILKELRNIGLKLLNELKIHLPDSVTNSVKFDEICNNYYRALTQKKDDKNKIYSIFESQIYCVAKGKMNKTYEFGTKVSLACGKYNRIIYYVSSEDENIHDSKTLPNIISNIKANFGIVPKYCIVDKGYQGRKKYDSAQIIIAKNNLDDINPEDKKELVEHLNRRSDIEEIISHMKNDYLLSKNRLRDRIGDQINPIICAAASNFMVFARDEQKRLLRLEARKKSGRKKKVKRSPRRTTRGVPFEVPNKQIYPSIFSI